MTYCVGIKLKQGLVGIADTRITSGSITTNAKKLYTFERENASFFLMTSGLRSVRDKALTYFAETIGDEYNELNKLYKVVNRFSSVIKQVASEDKASLAEAGLDFNIFTLIGGQMKDDEEHKLYLLYPQGNWIEIGEASPFMILGNSGYGTPILQRSLSADSTIPFALKTAILSFDSTRVCANDVGYPIDCFVYENGSFKIKEVRFEEEDLKAITEGWNNILSGGISSVAEDWQEKLLS